VLKIKWAEQSIIKQIRKPFKNDLRKPKSIGSLGFYIKSIKTKNPETESLKLNSTCNFEKRTGGVLLRSNYSNKLIAIPIPSENIIGITLRNILALFKLIFQQYTQH